MVIKASSHRLCRAVSCARPLLHGRVAGSSFLPVQQQQQQRWGSWWNPFNRDEPTAPKQRKRPDYDAVANVPDPAVVHEALGRLQNQGRSESIFLKASSENRRPGMPAALSASDESAVARVLDPDPRSRARWQRKLVVRAVRRTLPATRAERVARSERELLMRSDWLPASYKKLGKLARQVAGKTVHQALLQMRFSDKKLAVDVANHLRVTADYAVLRAGMGLGRATDGPDPVAAESPQHSGAQQSSTQDRPAPIHIRTATGRAVIVTDPTRMYIEQAWVNRGSYRPSQVDYKARGHCGEIRPPTCSISFRLKEEHTRIREHREREAHQARKPPWVHLPNRKIYGQRPFYSW